MQPDLTPEEKAELRRETHEFVAQLEELLAHKRALVVLPSLLASASYSAVLSGYDRVRWLKLCADGWDRTLAELRTEHGSRKAESCLPDEPPPR